VVFKQQEKDDPLSVTLTSTFLWQRIFGQKKIIVGLIWI
jgi:hypothetical protein